MSKNKNAQLRYNVIDRCFSNFQRKHTFYSILEEVNNELVYNDYDGIKLRQLQDDIAFMQSDSGFSIELEEGLKDGKRRVLRYSDKSFSISKHPLNQLDTEQLESTLTILSRYKNRPEYSWLIEFIPRMEQAFDLTKNDNDNNIISYQNNPDLTGLQWLDVLFNSIAKKKTVRIEYQPYKKEPFTELAHPYHLKQYNNRWFLACKVEGYDTITIYALDRIIDIEETGNRYIESDINWMDYFDEMIGVTKKGETEPVKIILKFSEQRIKYVLTKPLHRTQKPDRSDTTGLTIQIEVIPNLELYQTLLSFGPDVEVISPATIREVVMNKISAMQKNYNYAE